MDLIRVAGTRWAIVEVLRAYSNRSDLLEQLREAVTILSERRVRQPKSRRAGVSEAGTPSRRLRDRFTREDLQAMVDLYQAGWTSQQVGEKFGVSPRSVRRLRGRLEAS